MSETTTLPILSDDDLSTFFGNDAGGIRRYRLLSAILVQGLTQREAARSTGVSERTIRNVLHSYTRSGRLESLKSRQSGSQRRNDRKRMTYVQALNTALGEEPNAGGDRLWRRAQELLGDAGDRLSRRTAYRILAKLRDAPERSEDDLCGVVRAALPLAIEEPPLALGASALAQQFLPSEGDVLLRGVLLQQALWAALDRLRPAGAVSTIDRNWWPYLICTGEYETGQNRVALQEALALSASTYTRAKRQGIERITALLPQIIAQMIDSPVATAARRLPRIPDFIGRREEQAYYAWRLQGEGRAWIWGLPGSGKTALAAELAAEGQRYGQTVIWHTCHAGRDSTLAGLIRGLAQSLAGTGDTQIWQLLRQLPSEKQDLLELLELLREHLEAQASVVVLDDVHRCDPQDVAPLFEMLDELVARGATRLLCVGRARPAVGDWPALRGLVEREARLLWSNAPSLPADQWNMLYTTTGGLPQPLRQVAAAYRRAGELARLGNWASEVAIWAEETIWNQLDRSGQRVLAAVHAIASRSLPVSLAVLGEALDVGPVVLEQLQRRGLVTSNGTTLSLFGALQFGAAALLREDADLRETLAALDEALYHAPEMTDDATPVMFDTLDRAGMLAIPESLPTGLELIARLHEALERSSAYLHTRTPDHDAHLIATELQVLMAALPNPAGPR